MALIVTIIVPVAVIMIVTLNETEAKTKAEA